jgi:hypothetical protein
MPNGLRLRVFASLAEDLEQRDVELPGRGTVTQIDQTFWAQWLQQNQSADFVKRHFVYQAS